MVDQAVLPDGTRCWIWPLLPTDREALVREFETLSLETRRRRFLGPVVHLTDKMLKHLVDEVDGIDHVALVLMAEVGDDLLPVGVARCVRYPNEPQAADVAVTVKDAWQGRGVGTALLRALMVHRPAGVTHLLTEVASDNPASLAMLRRLGPMRTFDAGQGVLDVEVQLVPNTTLEVPTGDRLHPALTETWRPALRTRDTVCTWLTAGAEPVHRKD